MDRDERGEAERLKSRLWDFLSGRSKRRIFVYRFRKARSEVELCPCSPRLYGLLPFLWMNLRYGIIQFALSLPWSTPKVWILRLFGAKIGKGVYISQRVYIDAMYPHLFEAEDDVLIGYDAKIFLHEITNRYHLIGRVTLEQGSIVGACAVLRPGVVVGEGATVGALSAVIHSVPAGVSVFGIPAIPVEQIPGLRRARSPRAEKKATEKACDSS